MVVDPSEYLWSSFRVNGMGKSIEYWRPTASTGNWCDSCGLRSGYRELLRRHLHKPTLNAIRQAVNQGMALGSERF